MKLVSFCIRMCNMRVNAQRCRCDGMVDVMDSKSIEGNLVSVRVRPPVPRKCQAPTKKIFLVGVWIAITRPFHLWYTQS